MVKLCPFSLYHKTQKGQSLCFCPFVPFRFKIGRGQSLLARRETKGRDILHTLVCPLSLFLGVSFNNIYNFGIIQRNYFRVNKTQLLRKEV